LYPIVGSGGRLMGGIQVTGGGGGTRTTYSSETLTTSTKVEGGQRIAPFNKIIDVAIDNNIKILH